MTPTTTTPPDMPELKSCPFCGRDAWYQYSPPMVKCSVCPARSWDCGSRSEAYAAWNTRAETRPTPPADAQQNDLDGTEYEWQLAVPEEDAVKRPLQEAIDFKWHHVLNANGGYKFEEFSKETWGALPIGVIETLRIAAIRYRALQSPAPVTDAQREALEVAFHKYVHHGESGVLMSSGNWFDDMKDGFYAGYRAALSTPSRENELKRIISQSAQKVDVEALKREVINVLEDNLCRWQAEPVLNASVVKLVIDHLAATGRLAGIPEGYVLISEELVRFLNGEGTLDGWGFGERPAKSGTFWWRKYLPKTQEEK